MSQFRSTLDFWIVFTLLILSLGVYAHTAFDVITQARTWVDEVTYIVKSLSYVTGRVTPYSAEDPTWYMPLYFYVLGWWQALIGPGLIESRVLNAGLGLISAALVFDITRRTTGNLTASALGTAVMLTMPAVTFYFATATPIAIVSALVLFSFWLVVMGPGRASLIRSLTLGLIFGALYFFRQNMILVIATVAPLYVLGLRQSRLLHCLVIMLGLCSFAATLIYIFPDRLVSYALRLPVVTPLLSDLALFKDPLFDIEANTVGNVGLGLSLGNLSWQDIVDAFALPYAGLLLAVLMIILLAHKSLRILLIAPATFLILAVTHYIGSLDYCTTCILPYTAYFASIGAICAGLSAALIQDAAGKDELRRTVLPFLFVIVVVSLNQAASGFATRDEYRFYPSSQLKQVRPISEREETEQLAVFFRQTIASDQKTLPIHDLVTIPYALFLADRKFPVQGLNLRHSYRTLVPSLTEDERKSLASILGSQGLWNDDIMDQWIANKFDVIVYQSDPRNRDSTLESRISETFTRTASTGFRGWNVHIYVRNDIEAMPPHLDLEE